SISLPGAIHTPTNAMSRLNDPLEPDCAPAGASRPVERSGCAPRAPAHAISPRSRSSRRRRHPRRWVASLSSSSVTVSALPTCAEQLDDHAAWALEARYLAIGMNVVLAVSPERVVLGGGVIKKHGLLPIVRT